jgi:DNA-directed RNA polymerase subunit M/transcription elongation factor TFIIS
MEPVQGGGMEIFMKCLKCGYENPEGAIFCANCGAKIVAASQVPGSQDTTHASHMGGSENDQTASQNAAQTAESNANPSMEKADPSAAQQASDQLKGQNPEQGTQSFAQHQDNFNTYYHEQQNKSENVSKTPLPDFNPNIPPEYQPITMWGYFAYEILFSIPCIGLIALIFFSFGGAKNVNLRNFARSYFCFLIIACIVFALLGGCSIVFSVLD